MKVLVVILHPIESVEFPAPHNNNKMINSVVIEDQEQFFKENIDLKTKLLSGLVE